MTMNLKVQRVTNSLGFNRTAFKEEAYDAISAKHGLTSRCSCSSHTGERELPVRQFNLLNVTYVNEALHIKGRGLQGYCIACERGYRRKRIETCEKKFQEMTREMIHTYYTNTYGNTKTCSKCKVARLACEFPISRHMEQGLHNHCIPCSTGTSQGNGGLRDFIYMPDKDGIKYVKKETCERCGGADRLAVDHILPIAKGGTDCITNKQTLCIHCNSKKSDTIDCPVTLENLCVRYRAPNLPFTDNTQLSLSLTRKVYEFRNTQKNIESSVKAYAKQYNLGHNLTRIIAKLISFG
jgi:5-methylcytosine-specific restriction endonuclease McrA